MWELIFSMLRGRQTPAARPAFKQRGAGAVEVIAVAGVLIPLTLAGVQVALMYNAKNVLNNATFEAARVGAVENAKIAPMKEALTRNLVPLYGGGTDAGELAFSYGNAFLDLKKPVTASEHSGAGVKIEVLNPTKQAFKDFGYDDPNGERAIPNSHLKYRERSVGEDSGVNIQDANLLKIKVTYGYRLFVPLVNKVIGHAMAAIDPANSLYYLSDPPRLPIEATATVRMHSKAYLADNASYEPGSGGGAVPGGGGGVPPGAEPGAGGDADSPTIPLPDSGIGEVGNDKFFESLPKSIASNANDEGLACRFLRTCGTGTPGEFCYMTPQLAQSTVQRTELGSNSSAVENPINVLTGNKFQEEIDIAAMPGPLGIQFARYYNSQSTQKGALGYRWSHSYDVTLGRLNDQLVWVKQADGRSIVFHKDDSQGAYVARLPKDGTLAINETGAIWTWQSGRRVAFDAAGKVARVTDENGLPLLFVYDDLGRLIQVTDPQHRTLGFTYYHNNRIKEVFDATGKTVRYHYDFAGNLERVERIGGEARRYHYEDPRFVHNLTGITDGRGVRFAQWAYDDQGRAVFGTHPDSSEQAFIEYGENSAKVADSLGRVSTYSWKSEHGIPLLTRVDGPGCSKCGSGDVEFTYDEKLRLTRVQRKNGDIVEYEYDAESRTVEKRFFAERTRQTGWVRTEYHSQSRQPRVVAKPSINPNGEHIAEYVYDREGMLASLVEKGYAPDEKTGYRPIERTVCFSHSGDKVVAVDGPRQDVDDVVRFEYDQNGRLSSSRYPDGTVQKVLAYDSYDRPIRTQTNDEVETHYVYDPRGRLIQASRGSRVVAYEYDQDGRLTGLTNPNGTSLRLTYDDAGRPTGMVDGKGNRYGRVWDSADRPSGSFIETAAGEKLMAYFRLYDAEDRLRAVVSPQGGQYMVGYDEKTGRKNLELDGGKRGDFYFAADKATQYLGALAGDGGVTEVVGNGEKGITAIRDAAGRLTLQMRDDFGNLLIDGSPDTGVSQYSYDAAGNLMRVVDGAKNERKYRYDAAGRVVEATDKDGRSTFTYQNGRLASACRAANCDYYDYDRYGELVSHRQTVDGHTFETQYVYDKNTGELTERVLPSGETLAYRYQANLGRLSHISRKGWFTNDDILSDVTYQPFGLRTGYTLANGSRVAFEYDQTGRVTTLTTGAAGPWRFDYDPSGNIVAIERDGARTSYAYDAVSRLLEAAGRGAKQQFNYDTLGRREAPENPYIKVSSAANDDAYDRDTRGNTTRLGNRSFEYGVNGQPLKLFVDGVLRAEYVYNASGIRIKKTTYGDGAPKATYYLYDVQARLTAEANQDGEVTREYVYLGQTPVALLQDGKIYSVATDHLGTPVEVRDRQGRAVWQADYAAFGEADVKIQTVEFNLRFPGQYADWESGLHYNYYRYYDPRAGQYIQPDPMGIRTGLNRFAYVDSNPLRYTDPLGLFKVQSGTLAPIIVPPFGITVGYAQIPFIGSPVHESIVKEAFRRFNNSYVEQYSGSKPPFSAHTIGLFGQANVRTDLIFDDQHQFNSRNHFDNPTEGPPVPRAFPQWIQDTVDSLNDKRKTYGGQLGVSDLCAQQATPSPTITKEVWEPDIRAIVEAFGQNTHTIADFYAHSNWVDSPDRGGSYIQTEEVWDGLGTRTILKEQGVVPIGLNHRDEVWDETVTPDLYTGSAEGCSSLSCITYQIARGKVGLGEWRDYYHNVVSGVDENGFEDKTTHAYWAKDEPRDEVNPDDKNDPHNIAKELAIKHTIKEIQMLWDKSEGNTQLRDAYRWDRAEKYAGRVKYQSTESCALCPF